jgi:hypothetical protein
MARWRTFSIFVVGFWVALPDERRTVLGAMKDDAIEFFPPALLP